MFPFPWQWIMISEAEAAASSSHQQPEAQEPATPQAAAAATPDLPDQAATPGLPDQPQAAAASSVMSLAASLTESLVLEDGVAGVTESLVHFPDDSSDDSLPQATPATRLQPESEPPSATPQLQQVAGGQPQAAGGRRASPQGSYCMGGSDPGPCGVCADLPSQTNTQSDARDISAALLALEAEKNAAAPDSEGDSESRLLEEASAAKPQSPRGLDVPMPRETGRVAYADTLVGTIKNK